jgi:hypothetical protein
MKLKIIDTGVLSNFPSGSGLEIYKNRIYIVGDDAASVLIANKRWKEKDHIALFETTTKRISKKEKADLEATTLLTDVKNAHLLILGSGSTERRNQLLLINLLNHSLTKVDIAVFYSRLKQNGISDLNIEGAAVVNDRLLLANRGNKTNPSNHLIETSLFFWQEQETAPIKWHTLQVETGDDPIGISGLCYSPYHEQLLFTTSMEDVNSYDDGKIGRSYLGIIDNIYRKLDRPQETIKATKLIDLTITDKRFEGNKVESLCLQTERNNSYKIHLIADNDDGKSRWFKIRLKW